MLLAGVVLALVFVVLGVLLNSAAFTGAEAAREGASDAGDALSVQEDAVEGLGGALFYANYYNYSGGHSGIEAALRTDVRNWSNVLADDAASHRTIVEVELRSTTPGTQIHQDDARNFTDDNGTESWTLAGNATGVRRFSMNASVPNTTISIDPTVSNLTDAFHVEAERDGGQTRVFMYDDADGNLTVSRFVNGTLTDTWSADDGDALVELSAGRIDGRERENLSFPGFNDSFDVQYHNADNIEGTYGLVVDNASVDGSPYAATGSPGPHQVPAVYSATLGVTHRSATVTFVTNATVAPETTPNGTTHEVA